MSAPVYSQSLKPRGFSIRLRNLAIQLRSPMKSSIDRRREFFDQAAWLDAITFGKKARQHFCGLPFEAIEGDLHRMWETHGRSEWSIIRPLILQGWDQK